MPHQGERHRADVGLDWPPQPASSTVAITAASKDQILRTWETRIPNSVPRRALRRAEFGPECNHRDIQRQERKWQSTRLPSERSPLRRSTSGPTGDLCLRARCRGRHRRSGLHHREQSRHPAAGAAHLRRHLLHGVRRRAPGRQLQLGQAAARLWEVRLSAPLPAAGALSVVAEVADIQDKGEARTPSSCCGPRQRPRDRRPDR